jgi:ADP-ribose pyrophosphatase YjhB (NUDIX family)
MANSIVDRVYSLDEIPSDELPTVLNPERHIAEINRARVNFCHRCTSAMNPVVINEAIRLRCADDKCGNIFWNSPASVGTSLTVVPDEFIGEKHFEVTSPFNISQAHGILVVTRSSRSDTFKGAHALPGGFVEPFSSHSTTAIDETRQEANVAIEIVRLLDLLNPVPGITNHNLAFYLARGVRSLEGGVRPDGIETIDARIMDIREIEPGYFPMSSHDNAVQAYKRSLGY